MKPENPPGASVRIEIKQAAYRYGWRIDRGERDGWFFRESATAPGTLALAGASAQGPWLIAVDNPGMVDELRLEPLSVSGPGIARFAVHNLTELHAMLDRVYDLAMALPQHPLEIFEAETSDWPRSTEAEQLVLQRRGQAIFRQSLVRYWNRCCPITGITDPELLRASHMKPWAACKSNPEQRLDPYNGLLLSALWDSAFDAGLVSFDDRGFVLRASALSLVGSEQLGAPEPVPLTDRHRFYLAWHRENVFKG